MGKILTPVEIWKDFNAESQQLNTKIIGEFVKDGIIRKTVYFTSHIVGDEEVRIYAEIYQKDTKSVKPALLVIDDYNKPINHDELVFWAQNGFIAMSVDFVGKTEDSCCTYYPEQISYANACENVSIFKIDEGITHNRLYEYAISAMRAVTYLLREEKAPCVSVLSVGDGYHVGSMVIGIDKRIKNSAVALGSLYLLHPDFNLEANDDETFDAVLDRKAIAQEWTTGLAPQAYGILADIPVYVIGSVNSVNVDVSLFCQYAERFNSDSRLLLLPNVIDYVPNEYVNDIVRFLKGCESEVDLDLSVIKTDGSVEIDLKTNSSRRNVSVWYCRDVSRNGKNWVQAQLKNTNDGFSASLDMYDVNCECAVFALADSDISVSTSVLKFKATNQQNIKKPTNILYAGNSSTKFLPFDTTGKWHGEKNPIAMTEGYLGIKGTKGNSLATFALCDKSVRYSLPLTVSFDVCCDVKQKMTIYALTDYGVSNVFYSQDVQLIGDGKWQKIVVDQSAFRKVADNRPLDEESNIELIAFTADESFIINNICLV